MYLLLMFFLQFIYFWTVGKLAYTTKYKFAVELFVVVVIYWLLDNINTAEYCYFGLKILYATDII